MADATSAAGRAALELSRRTRPGGGILPFPAARTRPQPSMLPVVAANRGNAKAQSRRVVIGVTARQLCLFVIMTILAGMLSAVFVISHRTLFEEQHQASAGETAALDAGTNARFRQQLMAYLQRADAHERGDERSIHHDELHGSITRAVAQVLSAWAPMVGAPGKPSQRDATSREVVAAKRSGPHQHQRGRSSRRHGAALPSSLLRPSRVVPRLSTTAPLSAARKHAAEIRVNTTLDLNPSPAADAAEACAQWGCTCQGMADQFNVSHTRAWWGSATTSATAWWVAQGCKAVAGPSLNLKDPALCAAWNCTCRGMSSLYSVVNSPHDFGSAPEAAAAWWLAEACQTDPRDPKAPASRLERSMLDIAVEDTLEKFILISVGHGASRNPRCVDPYGLRWPLAGTTFSDGAGPWSCERWHFDAAGRLLAGKHDALCLGRDHLGVVKAHACVGATGSHYGECVICDEWARGSRGSIYAQRDPTYCLESAEPRNTPLVSHIGRMRPCAVGHFGDAPKNPPDAQRWKVWLGGAKESLFTTEGERASRSFPDAHSAYLERSAAMRARIQELEMASREQGEKKRGAAQNVLRMSPAAHVSHYRDFSDVYEATPISYLTGLATSSRKTEAGAAFRRLFEVREVYSNVTTPPPPNVISWALFVPFPAPAGEEHVWGPRSLSENEYARKAAMRPKSLEESRAGTAYQGKSFFDKFVQPMMNSHKKVNLRVGSQWRVRLHLCPTLAWLAPVLLNEGNIEVYIMEARSIRTLGAMWRWIPFDDLTITGSVLALDADDITTGFSNWNAVESWMRSTQGFMRWVHAWKPKLVRNWALDWDNKLLATDAPRETQWTTNPEVCSLNAGQTWSGSQQRWIGGNGGVRGPAYYGCKQYATAQANFFGAKPRMLSFSFIDTMVGFSLRRGVLGTTDGRWYPYASRRAHSFNGGFGGHPIGWGRSLFDYGFDEAFLKMPIYFRAVAEGSLYSVIPEGSDLFNPREIIQPNADARGLRCRNAFFLDTVWIARHAGNALETMKVVYSDERAALAQLGIDAEQHGAMQTRPRLLWPCRLTHHTGRTHEAQRFKINDFGCITSLKIGHLGLNSAFPYLGWQQASGVCTPPNHPRYHTRGAKCIHTLLRNASRVRRCETSQFLFTKVAEDEDSGSFTMHVTARGRDHHCAEANLQGYIFLTPCNGRASQRWVYNKVSETLSSVVPSILHPTRRMCLTVSAAAEDAVLAAARSGANLTLPLHAANKAVPLLPLDISEFAHECVASSHDSEWAVCANDGGTCDCTPGSVVRFGLGVVFREALMPSSGSLPCVVSSFRGIDPAPFWHKTCRCVCRACLGGRSKVEVEYKPK